MNREIKFRAWDGKKMYLPEYSDKEDFHLLADGTIVETHEYGIERHELTTRRGDNWKVMQYTGLKDKNGKEIYEGDIMKWNNDNNVYVQFQRGSFGAAFKVGNKNNIVIPLHALEVIGNIYENPELLT